MMSLCTRKFLSEFIKMYENEPCLWKVSSKIYRDKHKKAAGYAKLLTKLREVEPSATKDDVIKKINNIRSSARKEQKKINHSLKSGASGDSVYKPKLWYFSLLSFLAGQDDHRHSRSNVVSDDEGVIEGNTSETDVKNIKGINPNNMEGSQPVASSNTSMVPTPRTKLRKRANIQEDMAKEMLVQVNEYFKKPSIEEDRFDIVAKGFAIKLRGLPQQQMLLAERLMNDTLFQAEMGILTMSHRVVGEQHLN